MASVIPQDSLFGPLARQGAGGVANILMFAAQARAARDAEAQRKKEAQAVARDTLQVRLSKMTEDEQAQFVKVQTATTSDEDFLDTFGVSKAEYQAGLQPATGSQAAIEAEAGLPPQSPQEGEFGPKVARTGKTLDIQEQEGRLARQEADLATVELNQEGQRFNLMVARQNFGAANLAFYNERRKELRVADGKGGFKNPTTGELTKALAIAQKPVELLTAADNAELDKLMDLPEMVQQAEELTQFLEETGLFEDPAARAKSFMVETMINLPEEAARQANQRMQETLDQMTPDEIEATVTAFEEGRLPAFAGNNPLRVGMLYDMLYRSRALRAQTTDASAMSPTELMKFHTEVSKATGPLSQFLAEIAEFEGIQIDAEGNDVETGIIFKGRGDTLLDLIGENALPGMMMTALGDPNSPAGAIAYQMLGLPQPSATEALTAENIDLVIDALERQMGIRFDKVTMQDSKGEYSDLLNFREQLRQRAFASRRTTVELRNTFGQGVFGSAEGLTTGEGGVQTPAPATPDPNIAPTNFGTGDPALDAALGAVQDAMSQARQTATEELVDADLFLPTPEQEAEASALQESAPVQKQSGSK